MKIIVYGDSNTWGLVPGSLVVLPERKCARFDENTRWSARLKKELEISNLTIIEAGLNGRTTDIDDETWAGRSALKHLPVTLEENAPVDILILMLGTNDFKSRYRKTPEQVAASLEKLIDIARLPGPVEHPTTKIILINPLKITNEDSFDYAFKDAIVKRNLLTALLRDLASKKKVIFLDSSAIPISLIDGIHLDEHGHALMAKEVALTLKYQLR